MNPALLEKYRQQLQNRLPLIGSWIRDQALQRLAEDGSAEAVRLLEEAVTDADDSLREAALALLEAAAQDGNVAAREALCRLVIHHGDVDAQRIVSEAGYLPHDEAVRAIFFFVTEQWDRYAALDFDHQLLRAAYDQASGALRKRIASRARKAGRLEWVGIVAGEKQGRRLSRLTPLEWRAALAVLENAHRYADLWRLAQEAPPPWSAAILRRLGALRWEPGEADREGYRDLVARARLWPESNLSRYRQPRAALQAHDQEVRCLAMTPDGRWLASGGADARVRLWRLPDLQLSETLEGHAGWVNCLAISPDGRLLASAGRGSRVHLWKLPSGEPWRKLKGYYQAVFGMAISPDSRILACGSSDGIVRLWSLPNGELLGRLEGHDGSILCLAISPDGSLLASGSADGTIRLWRLPEGRCRGTLKGHLGLEQNGVICLAISADGELLATGGMDSNVRLWRLPGGMLVHHLRGHTGQVNAVAFTPDCRLLIAGGADHEIQVWDVAQGTPVTSLRSYVAESCALLISPDGQELVTSTGSGSAIDTTVRLWQLPEGAPLQTLTGHSRSIPALAMSHDGYLLATGGSDGVICLWAAELRRLCRLPAAQATLSDLDWLQNTQTQASFPEEDLRALAFMAALLRWRHRSDILVDEAAPRVIEIGAFDIEIEG